MYREISPEKLLAKRGNRTRQAIAQSVNFQITEQDLWGYEHGKWQPSKKKLPHLLAALDATYEEITEPVELAASV